MTFDPWTELSSDGAEPARRESVRVGTTVLRKGDRVRLQPRGRADIFDLALVGKTATIESIEVDYEDIVYLAVTVDDDPGRDLGMLRQPGHRFFFTLADVVPLGDDDGATVPGEGGAR